MYKNARPYNSGLDIGYSKENINLRKFAPEKLWIAHLKNESIEGRVKIIKPYGAIIELGLFSGLLHISNIRKGYIKDINDIISVGDKLAVKIIKLESEISGVRIYLSTPGMNIYNDNMSLSDLVLAHRKNQNIVGVIRRIYQHGALIGLGRHRGFFHFTKNKKRHIMNFKKYFSEGDEINVSILSIYERKKGNYPGMKISLSVS